MHKLIRQKFDGDGFFLVEAPETQEQFLVVRHICELLGLAIDARHKRLRRTERWRYEVIDAMDREGRAAKVAVIPIILGAAWLLSIGLHKEDTEKVEKVSRFARHFESLSIEREVEKRLATLKASHERIGQHVLAVRPLWAQLKCLADLGYDLKRASNEVEGHTREVIQAEWAEMQRCGLIAD